jgi:hypothetical protein
MKMNVSSKIFSLDKKALFSTLWIFAVLNYLYCDVMGLMDSALLEQFLQGNVGGVETTQGFFLAAALLMEISMSMVLLSKILPYGVNRWANIIAGAITTVVQVSSLFFGSAPTAYYIFFSVIEVSCTLFITVYAWNWANSEGEK